MPTIRTSLILAGIMLITYLLGSVNFAIVIARIFAGDDIRRHGSGNAGMTNMLRTYGKWPAVFTALGDFLKAVAAVFISRLLGGHLPEISVDIGYLAGIFVILGHMFPLYFRFKGGKGVMTGLGVIVSVNPPVFLMVLILALPLIAITRVISVASIAGAIDFATLTPVWAFLFTDQPWYYSVCAVLIGGMILIVHRGNIARLIAGSENRLGKRR